MKYAYWAYVVLFVLGCFGNILSIGKERKPITPAEAAGVIVIYTPLLYLLVRAALAGV